MPTRDLSCTGCSGDTPQLGFHSLLPFWARLKAARPRHLCFLLCPPPFPSCSSFIFRVQVQVCEHTPPLPPTFYFMAESLVSTLHLAHTAPQASWDPPASNLGSHIGRAGSADPGGYCTHCSHLGGFRLGQSRWHGQSHFASLPVFLTACACG